ncbi:universal stress protein, partial [Candidatus Acetothermia bacterium]|nr:universal stress protein [Candidatus Acetothermia bacterium]
GEDSLATQVVQTAGQLAQQLGAYVIICHVMPEDVYESNSKSLMQEGAMVQPFTIDQALRRAKVVADKAAMNLRAFGVQYEAKGLTGQPEQKILSLAQQLKVDLIVMGFEGLHGLEKLRALGSVSRAVMEQTNLPVLIVPAIKAVADEPVIEKLTAEGALVNERKPHPIP